VRASAARSRSCVCDHLRCGGGRGGRGEEVLPCMEIVRGLEGVEGDAERGKDEEEVESTLCRERGREMATKA
jgi:hypothetical protein